MNQCWIIVLSAMLIITGICAEEAVTKLTVSAGAHQKVPLCIVTIGNDQELYEIAQIVARDFSFSGQWQVTVEPNAQIPTKTAVEQFAKNGFPAVFFLNKNGSSVEWRLYDAFSAQMLASKKQSIMSSKSMTAHAIADDVWPSLTNQSGFFSTKIAYCVLKKTNSAKGNAKHLYIADYDGSNVQILVDLPTINVAPRWNRDVHCPLLFYSEYTDRNVRLMFSTMDGKRAMVSNFDGVNMLPSFSSDGKKAVFCASRGQGVSQLYFCDKSSLSCLVNNGGNNVAPTFAADDNTIFFCSDFQTGSPQIFSLDLVSSHLNRITTGGFCVSPDYSRIRNQLVYVKTVCGVMQLFIYDVMTKKHQQLTTDVANKEECCWSSCGNYLLFSVEDAHGIGRIAIQSLLTGERKFVTEPSLNCSYPHWSPRYMSNSLNQIQVQRGIEQVKRLTIAAQ